MALGLFAFATPSYAATFSALEKSLNEKQKIEENQEVKINQKWVEKQTVQSLVDNGFAFIHTSPVLANDDYVIFNLAKSRVGQHNILVTCFVTLKSTKCRIP